MFGSIFCYSTESYYEKLAVPTTMTAAAAATAAFNWLIRMTVAVLLVITWVVI